MKVFTPHLPAASCQQSGLRLNSHLILLGLLLATLLCVRLVNLRYNSAFVDEAIYIVNGQRVLNGTSGFVDLRYMFGSYLYPAIAAAAGYLFGDALLGARLASALISTLGAIGVYLLGRRLFSPLAGLFAAAVYGLVGISIFVGQLATYDVLSINLWALTLAVFSYAITTPDPLAQARMLFYAGILLAFAFLSKYLVILFAPLLLILGAVLLLNRQSSRLYAIVRHMLIPAALIILAYIVIFLDKLLVLVQGVGQFTAQPAARAVIFQEALSALWLPGLLALLGALLLLAGRRRSDRLLVLLALAGAAIPPLYHLSAANIRALDKHLVYSLVLLAPLAGHALAIPLAGLARQQNARLRAFSQSLALGSLCILLLLAAYPRLQGLQQNWPDLSDTVDYAGRLPVDSETLIIAEAGPLYDLYLDWQQPTLIDTWNNSFGYAKLEGTAAMLAAVRDRKVDYLILDRFYTPGRSYRLEEAARQAGYRLLYRQYAKHSAGEPVVTVVYGKSAGETANAAVR